MFSKVWKVTVVLMVAIAAAAGTLAFVPRGQEGVIPAGIHVAGMDWGGKSESAARGELQRWRRAKLENRITLKLPSETTKPRKWTPRRSDLGVDIDIDATLQAATQLEGEGPLQRLSSWFTAPKSVKLDPVWKIDQLRIQKYLKTQVAPRVYVKPKDARLVASDQGLKKLPEASGVELDLESTTAAVGERIPESGAEAATVALKPARPQVTVEDLEGIEEEIARFRTTHNGSGNRSGNIELACSKINGTVLKPGDIFSYNKVVGPRERAHGYKTAPVISEGRLVPGMAGGVCQTSSTLYNAVLLADLKVIRRSHHSFPVHYLPAGRDATVAYGSIDFQFQNNLDGPIAIMADGSRGQVVMRIFGRKAPGKTVQIVSSRSGLNATVWRTVKLNGKQVRRELLSRDHYNPAPPKEPSRQRIAARRAVMRARVTSAPRARQTSPESALPAATEAPASLGTSGAATAAPP